MDDADLREIFRRVRCIAVVGMKDDETADAYRIPLYLQRQAYRIVPVNPKFEEVLGERAYPSLDDVDVPVDLVNLFRAPQQIPAHVEEILRLSPPPQAVWMQLGIHHGPAAAKLRERGIHVVQDRCIMVEHRRLSEEAEATPAS